MHPHVEKILLSEEQIKERVYQLGQEITKDYQDKDILVVGILKGAMIFLADLVRNIEVPTFFDFMAVSSYGAGTVSSGAVRILKDLDKSIEGKHVIIVEDIVDTGLTLQYLVENMKARGPASLKICTLLDKPSRRKVDVTVDYNGFSIPDEFVVGYGLDFNERYRNLPYIAVLKPEIYRG
ncbi:hypoxanthine phosphoribosyltransferase [Desulfotomaculum nigrificans CO-1-SRB]|uniref:Hypoxanthine phosphoribosyltransferase n=1 Tax=Desulfotomaculum nigrificans (strain DSM 14880 / VKM B-2319 / CO-1-SRB) TaxID=868595 RepID=F6B7X5_DESCC|nr:hypoxanthine phosphoribosyltransferase [Desulfotomaculum nigrificans]AEF94612.1 hypoxanthine phosphoribosyltransferase [Desulfotomaculum nigrificans CO-1-SRB]